jgi:hypothetical protein
MNILSFIINKFKKQKEKEKYQFRIVEHPVVHKMNYLEPQVKTMFGWEPIGGGVYNSNKFDTMSEAEYAIKAYIHRKETEKKPLIIHEVTNL